MSAARKRRSKMDQVIAAGAGLPDLNFTMVSEPWIDFMIQAAGTYDIVDASSPFVDAIHLKPGYECLRVKGNVPPHTDRAFPRWVYMLAFRGDDAVMCCHGHRGMRLRPGMLLEFDEHRRHRVEQSEQSFMIWTPLDSDRRLSLEEALEGHRKQFLEGNSALLAGRRPEEICADDHRIVHDGRIVWVYDASGFCIARLGRGGYALAHRDQDLLRVETQYDIKLRRRPGLADWHLLVKKLAERGIELPDSAMPKWLSGAVSADL